MAEQIEWDWLKRIREDLSKTQSPEGVDVESPQYKTYVEGEEKEEVYDAPRDLGKPWGQQDLEGVIVEPSLGKVLERKGEEIVEWGKKGVKDLFVGDTKTGDLLVDDPSLMTDAFVRGAGSGILTGIKNTAEFFGFKTIYEEGSKALDYWGLDHNVVFNLPGLKGYDEDKDMVFLSSDGYLEDKIEKGEAFHFPEYPEPVYGINKVLKPLARYLSGFLMARAVLPSGTFIHPSKYKNPIQYDPKGFGRDILGTVATFKPHEPRLSDSLEEFVEDTPIPLLEGVVTYLKSDPNDTEAEGYLKMVIEGSAIGKLGDAMVGLTMKIYKNAKTYYSGVNAGLSPGQLDKISAVGASDIKEYMDGIPKTQENLKALKKLRKLVKKKEAIELAETPKGSPKKETKAHKEKMTPEEELVLKSIALGDADVEVAILAMLSGKLPESKRILNLGASKEIGWEQVISAIAAIYKRRQYWRAGKRKSRTGIIELERQTATQKKGEDIYEDLTEFEVAASIRGESANKLKKAMLKKYADVKDAGAHMFAYRVVLRDLSLDLSQNISNNLDKLHDPTVLWALQNDFQEISNLYFYYGNIRGELARSVTSMRIDVPAKWINKADGSLKKLTTQEEGLRNAFISAQMNKNGWNPEMVQMIGDIMRQTGDPLKAISIIDRGMKAAREGGWAAFMEIYRNIILGSTTVFETAIVSGFVETFYPMVRDMIGTTVRGGVRTLMGKPAEMDALLEAAYRARGTMLLFPRAAKNALYSLMHEKNILDPLRSIVDETNKQMVPQFAIATNASGALARVFNLTGQVVRLTTRGIASIDEYLKQTNYGAWAYSKIMMKMPNTIKAATPEIRRAWTKKEMAEFYDSLGRATNTEGLEQARRTVFQEDLVLKSWSHDLQSLVKNHPIPAEAFVPIMRTPANVVKRITERTVGMSVMRAEVRRKWTGTPQEQAEVLGDVIISTALLGGTAALITSGQVTGAGPTDPKLRELWIAAGYVPYSIKAGDKWVPYDRLAPFSGPVMMVANVYENAWKYNNNKEEIGERMLLGIMKSIGDMHFISNFYNFFKGVEEAGRTGDLEKALWEKPKRNFRLPRIINQGFHAYQGHDDYKEIANLTEQWDVDIANITGNWENLGGEKWNWITGEKIDRDMSYWSGYAWTDYEEHDPVIQELIRMGFHVNAPQRNRSELGIQLSPEQFSDYKFLIGNEPIYPHPKTGKRMKMIDTLRILMGSNKYAYDDTRVYPDNPGKPNWRHEKASKIVRKHKDVAWEKLLMMYPKLKEAVDARTTGLLRYRNANGDEAMPLFKKLEQEGYTPAYDNETN